MIRGPSGLLGTLGPSFGPKGGPEPFEVLAVINGSLLALAAANQAPPIFMIGRPVPHVGRGGTLLGPPTPTAVFGGFPVIYYWVGGTGTWDGVATTHWSTASGGPAGAGPPTIGDDVVLDANSGTGTVTTTAAAACRNLSITWTSGKANTLSLGANFAPAGAMSVVGNATTRILVQSSVVGTQRTVTLAVAPTLSNVNFIDIASAGAGGTWSGTNLGDGLGNAGITMTASATQTATGTASFTWSSHAWSGTPSRLPLPQDDVVINNAFIAGRIITVDTPQMGRNIDFTGGTGSPALSAANTTMIFGSLTLVAGMTQSSFGTRQFMARSAVTLTSAGVTFTGPVALSAPGSTLTLQDDLTITFGGLSAPMGSFVANNKNVTTTVANFAFTATGRNLSMGSGTWNLTGTGAVWNINTTGGMTFDPSTSTIKITDASASAKSFTGFGLTYNNLWFNNAGTGALQVVGSNTFNQFQADSGTSVQFTAGTTTTAPAAGWLINGITIGSITAAGHTLAVSGSGKVKATGITVSRSTGSPTFTFYDMSGGTDGGNNVNWQFYNPDYVLSDAAGSFAITGVASAVTKGYKIVAAAGSFALTGFASTLLKTWKVNAVTGALVITGNAAVVSKGYHMVAAAGSYAITGNAATLRKTWGIIASAGVFAFTPFAGSLIKVWKLGSGVGAYSLTGKNAAVAKAWKLLASARALVLTGYDATLLHPTPARTLLSAPGALAIGGVVQQLYTTVGFNALNPGEDFITPADSQGHSFIAAPRSESFVTISSESFVTL